MEEIEKAFLSFLGMLRSKYLERDVGGENTFKSVIVAGVYDINLNLKSDEQHSYNSPWNIAASFDVDMSFSPHEIATMLTGTATVFMFSETDYQWHRSLHNRG